MNWPAKGSAEDDLYFRWLIARYAAYPNVHWDLAKEANNEKGLDYKIDRLRFIRGNDPYHRLLTVHDDHATYDRRHVRCAAGLTAPTNSTQSGARRWRRIASSMRGR